MQARQAPSLLGMSSAVCYPIAKKILRILLVRIASQPIRMQPIHKYVHKRSRCGAQTSDRPDSCYDVLAELVVD
jgi:hypothetical protein